MKAVVRSVVAIKYSDNREGLTYESFKNELNKEKLLPGVDIDYLIDSVEKILEHVILRNINDDDNLDNAFSAVKGISNSQRGELIKAWKTERDNVYTYLLKKASPFPSLVNMNWTLNLKTFSKENTQPTRELTCLVRFQTVKEEKVNSFAFELARGEVDDLYNQLASIDEAIERYLS
eukprot:TRINITY_DN935_c0_g3_i2.p1 TRINITY_DN935_c0_g3~~TRINITY_DN935_c0_g3_i2.p1  ORF type:complete len:177 (+),score=42.97 TRINITY_DN935_c0_g3_i2:45-575(+)